MITVVIEMAVTVEKMKGRRMADHWLTMCQVQKRSSCLSGCVGREVGTGRAMIGDGLVEALEGPASLCGAFWRDEQAVGLGAVDDGADFVAGWIFHVGA